MSKNKHKFLTFAALMTGATVAVHFINHTIATAAQLKQMLHISNDNYFEWRFGNIYYTKKGTGSPILLIHDTLPGASGYEWSKIEDELAIDHTVYTVDLLGCGRSDKSSITYTNFVYVQMISDFIKKIIGQKTDVIASGFSGSFVTMACHNEKAGKSAQPDSIKTDAKQKGPPVKSSSGNSDFRNSGLSYDRIT